jgi:HEAT repeat protein
LKSKVLDALGSILREKKVHVDVVLTAVKPIIHDESMDEYSRPDAGTPLGYLGMQGLPTILAAARDKDQIARQVATKGLFFFAADERAAAAKEVVPMLVALLADENEDVRCDAAFAMTSWAEQLIGHVDALVRALDDEATVEHAIRTLARMGPAARSALPALARLAKEHSYDCAGALGTVGEGDPAAREALLWIVENGDFNASERARNALGQMANAAVDSGDVTDADLDALMDARTNKSYERLRKLGDRALKRILDLLEDEDSGKRFIALHTLGEMRDRALPHVPKIAAKLTSKDDDDRNAASSALASLGKSAVDALVSTLGDTSAAARAAAASALGAIGLDATDAGPALAKLLDDPDESVHPKHAPHSLSSRPRGFPRRRSSTRSSSSRCASPSRRRRGKATRSRPALSHTSGRRRHPQASSCSGLTRPNTGSTRCRADSSSEAVRAPREPGFRTTRPLLSVSCRSQRTGTVACSLFGRLRVARSSRRPLSFSAAKGSSPFSRTRWKTSSCCSRRASTRSLTGWSRE